MSVPIDQGREPNEFNLPNHRNSDDAGCSNVHHLEDVNINQEHSTPNRNQGSSGSSVPFFTPNGTRYFIPEVPSIHKPVVGTVFNSLEEALVMYESYAEKAGFTVRKSTAKHKLNGELTHRLFVCNREGKPRLQTQADSLKRGPVMEKSQEQPVCNEEPNNEPEKKKPVRQRRNSNFKVTDCYARIKLRLIQGTEKCFLYGFVEEHNHVLDQVEDRHLARARRQLEYEDRRFIQLVGTNNIGPVRAHRLRACLNGGYDQVRGTVVDYKNHKRDVNVCIGERDAQMLINKFANRKLNNPELCFEYKTEQNELVAFFWADETSRCNYQLFGDVLAFDATYRTNRYSMVFVPFTGVDHHNKCVTFGGGLLKYETIESYQWLLNAFMKANPNQPQLVLTDQDAAMKEAVKKVFTESTHRLCMWHVMRKLPFKVCGELLKNTDLRRRIHKLVWDVLLTVEKFEARWQLLIRDFNLEANTWLSDMFKIRDRWVPGFFFSRGNVLFDENNIEGRKFKLILPYIYRSSAHTRSVYGVL
ncbi:protein FAR1-RELATED SEQUENCE 5-like [Rutidosis leptorrhynchoides]|uniref:protein FAR1-RELATED SEQUENCE 5-like n=1 Tax=Rutidosis leptorrhynchoides TaxID=125765 RepID=UPI003A98D29E